MSEIITNRGGMVVQWLAQKVLGSNQGWDLSIWSVCGFSAGTQSAVQTYAWGWVNWWFLNWPQVWMCVRPATDRWPDPGCTLCPALWIGSSNPKSDGWMKNKYSIWNLKRRGFRCEMVICCLQTKYVLCCIHSLFLFTPSDQKNPAGWKIK